MTDCKEPHDRLQRRCMLCREMTRTAHDQTYSDWTCSHCGQRHVYEEGHMIELSEEQIRLLLAAKAPRI